MRRDHLLAFCVFLLAFSLPAGCKKDDMPTKSPVGMVLQTLPTDRTSPAAARYIYGLVPPAFQSADVVVRVRELGDQQIAQLRARDLFDPLSSPPYGLVGYTCFTGHNPDAPADPDTIYLVPHRPPAEIAHTAVHEWGQVVHYRMLGQGEWGEWELLYGKLLASHQLAPGYEVGTAGANFAEYFALWCGLRHGGSSTGIKLPGSVQDYFDTLLSRRK